MRRSTWCCVSLESLLIGFLCVPHCPAAFAYSVQRCSFTPNTRSDSVFENPTTTAKLMIQPAIRAASGSYKLGHPTQTSDCQQNLRRPRHRCNALHCAISRLCDLQLFFL